MLRVTAFAFALVISLPAFAACPSPFVAKDGTGASQNLASVNNGSNNCEFPYVIGDGAGATNFAAVKAASTAAVAGDPALAVTMSPNTASVPVTPPANQSVNVNQFGGAAVATGGVAGSQLVEQGCAGQTVANTSFKAINNAGSASNLKLVSLVSGKNVYICSINLSVGTATNVALVDGTKTTNECDTATGGMAGGATAATGFLVGANGQITMGNGQGALFKTTAASHDVCLFFSAANQVSGSITYAQF
jgi:hypothetical protein